MIPDVLLSPDFLSEFVVSKVLPAPLTYLNNSSLIKLIIGLKRYIKCILKTVADYIAFFPKIV